MATSSQALPTISTEQLEVYKGVFDWNTDTLIANIQATKPDYNVKDPATWPIITVPRMNEINEEPFRRMRKLPFGIVFPAVIVCDYVKHEASPQRAAILVGNKSMNRLFHDFPFHFDQFGRALDEYAMTTEARIAYASHVSPRPPPAAPTGPRDSLSSRVRPQNGLNSGRQTFGQRLVRPTRPKTTDGVFLGVIQMLASKQNTSKPGDQRKYETVGRQLIEARKALEKEKTRALENEVEFTNRVSELQATLAAQSEKAGEDLEKLSTAMSNRLATEKERAGAAEERIKFLENEVGGLQELLSASRQETNVANDRMFKIWEKLKSEEEPKKRKKGPGGVGNSNTPKRSRF
ncbi:hypothetical protein CC80DRAFT_592957 [Byssothecium circinans]|uniref:Uncharacterized protein n=1 Tax=Byssothecium circinans TaxID=147558 RepID=A0A6A5TVJ3_9PLEO|nr:hypothetical protein CC80DRAFT_592957 [Byssothecium circinans]